MEIVVIIVMLLLSAFFSGSEIAFVSANRLRTQLSTHRPGPAAAAVRHFYEDPSTLLTTTLVGNNLALILYSTLAAVCLAPPLEYLFAGIAGLGEGAAGALVLLGQTIIASAVVLVVGEIIPKTVMREMADRAIFVVAIPLRFTYYLLLPLIKLAGLASNLIVRLLGTEADSFAQFMRRDFELILEENRASGNSDASAEGAELLENVLNLASIRVKESMVPRTDIIAVDENSSIEDVRRRFIETGHSKLPVYRENVDRIVGIVFAHDLFDRPQRLDEIIRPARYVPEFKLSKRLLKEFLETNSSIAVVIDEYGGTAGLVTREDLLEELFGDIQDEFDVEEEVMRQLGENVFIVSGRVRVEELNERYRLDIREGDYETIAGFVLENVGTIPAAKQDVMMNGLQFTILKATSSRIDLMKIVRVDHRPAHH